MPSQLSTAVSDAVLALSAFHAASQVCYDSFYGMFGFILVGAAASAGVYRFGAPNPGINAINGHQYLSWLASTLGMSYIAAAYHRQYGVYFLANIHIAVAVALILLKQMLSDKILSAVTEVVSSSAVVVTLLMCVIQFNPYGLIGAGVYAAAGLMVGTDGYLFKIPRVDLFHYALVIGNIALMMGLSNREVPLFYKPSVKTP